MTQASFWWSFMPRGKMVSITCYRILVRPILCSVQAWAGGGRDRPPHVRQG